MNSEITLSELTDKISSMNDSQIVDYSKLHISLDSGILIIELIKRFKKCKEKLNQVSEDDHI